MRTLCAFTRHVCCTVCVFLWFIFIHVCACVPRVLVSVCVCVCFMLYTDRALGVHGIVCMLFFCAFAWHVLYSPCARARVRVCVCVYAARAWHVLVVYMFLPVYCFCYTHTILHVRGLASRTYGSRIVGMFRLLRSGVCVFSLSFPSI